MSPPRGMREERKWCVNCREPRKEYFLLLNRGANMHQARLHSMVAAEQQLPGLWVGTVEISVSPSLPGWNTGANISEAGRLGLNAVAPLNSCCLEWVTNTLSVFLHPTVKGNSVYAGMWLWPWECTSDAWHCGSGSKFSTCCPCHAPHPPFPGLWFGQDALHPAIWGLSYFHIKVARSLRAAAASCSALHVPWTSPSFTMGSWIAAGCLFRSWGKKLVSSSLSSLSLSLPPSLPPSSPPSLLLCCSQACSQKKPSIFPPSPPSFPAASTLLTAEERKRQGAAPNQGCYSCSSLGCWIHPLFPQGSQGRGVLRKGEGTAYVQRVPATLQSVPSSSIKSRHSPWIHSTPPPLGWDQKNELPWQNTIVQAQALCMMIYRDWFSSSSDMRK